MSGRLRSPGSFRPITSRSSPMRTPERPLPRILPLLICAALAGCSGKEKEAQSVAANTAAAANPAAATKPSAFAPPKAEPGPGEKGYVLPPSTKQTPPLIQATVKGNLDAVKALLDGGSDPSVAIGGITALHIAVGDNKMEIFKALLDKGADTGA